MIIGIIVVRIIFLRERETGLPHGGVYPPKGIGRIDPAPKIEIDIDAITAEFIIPMRLPISIEPLFVFVVMISPPHQNIGRIPWFPIF